MKPTDRIYAASKDRCLSAAVGEIGKILDEMDIVLDELVVRTAVLEMRDAGYSTEDINDFLKTQASVDEEPSTP